MHSSSPDPQAESTAYKAGGTVEGAGESSRDFNGNLDFSSVLLQRALASKKRRFGLREYTIGILWAALAAGLLAPLLDQLLAAPASREAVANEQVEDDKPRQERHTRPQELPNDTVPEPSAGLMMLMALASLAGRDSRLGRRGT